MKTKVLLSSIVTIVLCVCLIAGSTFALFTAQKELDVEVTAGNVTIDASINNFQLWSVTPDANGVVVDENGATYSYVDPTTVGAPAGSFIVGGTGTNDGNLIQLDKIVPGDKVSFTVDTTNDSDVTILVRYIVKVENPTVLAGGMILNVDGTDYTGVASYTSVWTTLTPGTSIDPVAFELGLPVYAGNEYQDGEVNYSILVEAVQGNASVASYDEPIVVAANDSLVYTIEDLQALVNAAEDGDTINIGCDLAGDIVVEQKANRKITINGNGYDLAGTITVNGKSATIKTAGLTIKNLTFTDSDNGLDACVRLGGNNSLRYVCNVEIIGCTFNADGKVGVKSYTGGDYNISIIDCIATEKLHSLAQLKGVDGLLIEGCTVKSVRGMSLNNSNNVTVNNCTIDVQKYAVRFGESASSNVSGIAVTNCTLKSLCLEGDAVVITRGTINGGINLNGTTIEGEIKFG